MLAAAAARRSCVHALGQRTAARPPCFNPLTLITHPRCSPLNPTTPNPSPQGVDFVNNFEDYHKVWMAQDGDRRFDCPCKGATRCIASMHQYPAGASKSDLAATMRMMSARGYRCVRATAELLDGAAHGCACFQLLLAAACPDKPAALCCLPQPSHPRLTSQRLAASPPPGPCLSPTR